MTNFDESYYALIKEHMSHLGIWPEQSKYVRIILSLTMTVATLTFIGPQLARLHDIWGDAGTVVSIIPQLLSALMIFIAIMNSVLKADEMKVILERMEKYWKFFKSSSAVIVLYEYAESGHYLTTLYAIYINVALALYFAALITPVILDFVDPLNETRPKENIYEAEYGVDPDKYYWFILAHGYIVTIMLIKMVSQAVTIYILLVEHACALFEVVGFNLKLVTPKYMVNKKKTVAICNDCNYRKICDCIIIHKEAISFADLIEGIYSVSFVAVMGITAILISVTGVQVLINLENPKVLIRITNFTLGQIFHLYLNSIPGQKLIDHSLKIQTFIHDLDWYDMSVKAQKLLILTLIRSNRPCCLTAGKVYILSMESFGSAMQTVVSYFMMFAQLLYFYS